MIDAHRLLLRPFTKIKSLWHQYCINYCRLEDNPRRNLLYAVYFNEFRAIKHFVENEGVNITAPLTPIHVLDVNEITPLDFAVYNKRPKIVRYFLENGAPPNLQMQFLFPEKPHLFHLFSAIHEIAQAFAYHGADKSTLAQLPDYLKATVQQGLEDRQNEIINRRTWVLRKTLDMPTDIADMISEYDTGKHTLTDKQDYAAVEEYFNPETGMRRCFFSNLR